MESVINIFSKILEMSLQASIAILLIIIVREIFKLMRVPKKFSYLLWIIPFIRLAVPFSLESAFSIMPGNLNVYEKVASAENQQSFEHGNDIHIEGDNIPDHSVIVENGQPVIDSNNNDDITNNKYIFTDDIKSKSDRNKEHNMPGLWHILSVVWILGVASIVLYSMVSLVVFKRRLNTRVAVVENIFQCDYIDTAFVFGMFTPKIYIPSRIRQDEIEYVIAHENSHIRRLDHIVKPAAFFVVAIHWFNPFAWLGYVLMEKDMEMACDEAVLNKMGLDKRSDYAEALLNLSTKKHYALSIPTAFGEGDTKGRVKNVMKLKKPVIVFVAIAVVAVAVLGVTLLTNPEKDDASEGIDIDYENILPGTYIMEVDGTKDAFIPRFTVEEDKTFSFGYDPFSSYLAISFNEYEISEDKVIFTTNDGMYRYTFRIVDEKTLEFIKNQSSSVELVDEGAAYKIEDGSRFVLSDTEDKQNNDNADYGKEDGEKVDFSQKVTLPQAQVKDYMPLGADGVILDYVDGNILIFHGYAGIFAYNLDDMEYYGSIDLSTIHADKTQGDEAAVITVSEDGNYVYIKPAVEETLYKEVYDAEEKTNVMHEYTGMVVYMWSPLTGNITVGTEADIIIPDETIELKDTVECIAGAGLGNGFYSVKCGEVSRGVYGYLYCLTGLWKDIHYIESDMVYLLYSENDIITTVVGEYPEGEIIATELPNLTKENGLGNGGAILDYVDDKYIIFHGSYGLFVYDRTNECITDAFGLYGIECNYTSGNNACLVEVSDDRIYLTPGNQDKAYIYDIGDDVLISVGRNDIQNIKKERASLVLEDYVMLDHTSFMSYNCVCLEENGEKYYGYLISGTGLWYDLQYVEDRGGSHKTTFLLNNYIE